MKLLAQGVPIAPPLKPGVLVSDVYTSPAVLVNVLIRNSLIITSLLLFIALLYGGIRLIISSGGGDPKAMAANQQIVTTALIGFVIVFCATLMVTVIQTITGVQILN